MLDFNVVVGQELLDLVTESDDTLGLWHLLGAAAVDVRATAFDRLATLVPPPKKTSRSAIVASANARAGTTAYSSRREWLQMMDWYSHDW